MAIIRALRDLLAGPGPVTFLRALDHHGTECDQMLLGGLPEYLGAAEDPEGRRFAGIALMVGAESSLVLDTRSLEWLAALAAVVAQAQAELAVGAFSAPVRDDEMTGVGQ